MAERKVETPMVSEDGGRDQPDLGYAVDKRAEKILSEAKQKEQSAGSFLGKIFGGSKQEDAAELYIKAGNIYKANQHSRAAGCAYREAARVYQKLGYNHEAATALVDAGNLSKDSDPQMATECFREASELFMELGRFVIAAKHLQTIGEINEAQGQSFYDQSIQNFERAADFFKGENQRSSANKCMLRIAIISSNMGNYEKGGQVFEDLGNYCSENQLLKYSAKDHYFKGVICHFILSGAGGAAETMQRYIEKFPAFEGSREQKLLVKLIEEFNKQDEDAFTAVLRDFDSVSKLDEWLTKHLLIVKKKINEPQEDIN